MNNVKMVIDLICLFLFNRDCLRLVRNSDHHSVNPKVVWKILYFWMLLLILPLEQQWKGVMRN